MSRKLNQYEALILKIPQGCMIHLQWGNLINRGDLKIWFVNLDHAMEPIIQHWRYLVPITVSVFQALFHINYFSPFRRIFSTRKVQIEFSSLKSKGMRINGLKNDFPENFKSVPSASPFLISKSSLPELDPY